MINEVDADGKHDFVRYRLIICFLDLFFLYDGNVSHSVMQIFRPIVFFSYVSISDANIFKLIHLEASEDVLFLPTY